MEGVLANERMTAINSWKDLGAVLAAATMPGQQQYPQIRESDFWTEADVVLVSHPLFKRREKINHSSQ
jgi:hypothetical protein